MTDSEKKLGLLQQAGWEASAESDPHPAAASDLDSAAASDNGRAVTAASAAASTPRSAAAIAGEHHATATAADTAAAHSDTVPQVSSLLLMLYGIFGGVYVLYTFGWAVVAQQYSYLHTLSAVAGGSIWVFLQTVLFWAAVVAPAAWFVVAAKIARQRAANLIALLVLGIILLLPLPLFITTGGV